MICRACLKGKIKVYKTRYNKEKLVRYVKCPICGKKDVQIILYMDRYRLLYSFAKSVSKDLKNHFGGLIE